jgi:hypothetical protein
LLDVLDELLPADGVALDSVRLDAAAVIDALQRYIAALVYNRAIPVIDERLTRLEDPHLAQRRDRELRDYITALVRLHTIRIDPLALDWNGPEGRAIIEALLVAVYEQLEHGGA